jgi:hypothetical protein
MDMQSLLKHINSAIVQCGVLCVGGNANQPNNPRWFLTEKAMYEYMELLHHEVNHQGRGKISAMASKFFLGPRMYSTASKVISRFATCLQCVDAMLSNSPPPETTRAEVPWQSLSINVMHVPLSKRLSIHPYVLR